LAEVFGAVLGLCAKAGLVAVNVVAVDGSKVSANASREANVDYEPARAPPHAAGAVDADGPVALTERELQVAGLVDDRQRNPELTSGAALTATGIAG